MSSNIVVPQFWTSRGSADWLRSGLTLNTQDLTFSEF